MRDVMSVIVPRPPRLLLPAELPSLTRWGLSTAVYRVQSIVFRLSDGCAALQVLADIIAAVLGESAEIRLQNADCDGAR